MKYVISLFLIINTLTSCSHNYYDKNLESKYLSSNATIDKLNFENKEVLFLSITHLGTKTYYDNVKFKIDSLQKNGFKVFYEGQEYIRYSNEISDNEIIFYKKFRKITGIDILIPYTSIKPYSEYAKKYNLIDQPNYKELNVKKEQSENVDIKIKDLIQFYENNFNQIVLDNCDLSTNLKETYKCQTLDENSKKLFRDNIIQNLRNENLLNKIILDNNSKLLIIYGKNHLNYLKNVTK